ncbi:MAG: glycosyltransferase family 4 protein [Prolixibacteraceae bacterium]
MKDNNSTIKVLSVQPDDIIIGGVQIRSISIAKELNKKYNIQTSFLVAKEKDIGPFSKIAIIENYNIYYYNGVSRPGNIKSFKGILKNIKWLLLLPFSISSAYKQIRASNCQIIHINGLLNIAVLIASLISRKKTIYHLIGDHYPLFLIKSLRPFMKLPSKLVFIAEKLSQYYLGNKTIDYDIIYEPITRSTINLADKEKDKIKSELGIPLDSIIIGSIGNITPAKDWLTFIEVAKMLDKNKTENNFFFLIVGSISKNHLDYYESLREVIIQNKLEKYFLFTGYRDDIEIIINIFDIFLLTSINEGTPIVILEAMNAKIPIVSSDVGGIKEQIIHNKTGLLCEKSKINEYYLAVLYLIENPKITDRMTSEGHKLLKSTFSIEECTIKHYTLYKNLV